MKNRLKRAARALGMFEQARTLAERGRVVRRTLQLAPPYPLHRNVPIEPFFIVGSGRCGTTLLRRILMSSDEVHIPPENWRLSSMMLRFRHYRWSLDWEEIVRLVASRFAYQGAYRGESQNRVNRWFEAGTLHPVIEELANTPEAKRSLAHLVDGLYRYHGEVQEATFTRWGDKTPLNVWHTAVILEVFPKAKFIHLLRDGTDVASSFWKTGPYSTIQAPALRWKSAVTNARNFMESCSQCMEVRYEELVRDPISTVEEICNFLSVDFSPLLIGNQENEREMKRLARIPHFENVPKPISSSPIGKGHRTLGDEQKSKLATLIGDTLSACGYEVPVASSTVNPALR